MAMAVAFLLLSFLLGLLSLAIAEGAALLWAIRSLTRHRSSPSESGAPPLPVHPPADLKRRQVSADSIRFNSNSIQFNSISIRATVLCFRVFCGCSSKTRCPKPASIAHRQMAGKLSSRSSLSKCWLNLKATRLPCPHLMVLTRPFTF